MTQWFWSNATENSGHLTNKFHLGFILGVAPWPLSEPSAFIFIILVYGQLTRQTGTFR